MTRNQPREVRIAAPAYRDISDIWTWTVDHFGHAAALRYETLIDQAIADLADDPARPAAKERPDLLPGLWLYHLALAAPMCRAIRWSNHHVIS